MMKTSLKSSTALLMGLSLAMPAPIWAQNSEEILQGEAEAAAQSVTDALVPEADAAQEAEAETPAAEADAAQEAEAETPAAEADAAQEAASETPAAEADVAQEAASETPAVEADAAQEVEAETPAVEADAAQEAEAETPAAEADAVQEAAAETPAAEADAAQEAASETPAAEADAVQEAEVEGGEAQDIEAQQDDTATSTEAANTVVETQAAASADADQPAGEAEVQTQTVTEADTRTSDEDFATPVTAKGDSKKKGLSDFEKLAIGAIGAVAVGALLNNGKKVVANTGDRVVVQREDGAYEVLKDDNVLLRRPGVEVRTERFDDGSTRETVYRANGARVVTVKAASGQVLSRVRVTPEGREIVLFNDTDGVEPVTISALPKPRQRAITTEDVTADDLRLALAAQDDLRFERSYSLQQIRQIRAVRELVPVIELEAVNFETGSAAIRASEAEELRVLGEALQRLIERNPHEVFLVEGHTDAVGRASYNLALSDRRAESVALALTEYFNVPPENMVVQGYGESNLKIRTSLAERENRRATVRRITPLLRTASAQ